jgi:peptide-methionine (S)-S-oxide reductase
MAVATFAAGCFWGVEQRFSEVPGVLSTEVGYTGGTTARPSYEQVCSHTTGHAEAVRLEYDPEQVTYEHLLEVFFAMHDPTTPDRQGPDVGSQYRSAVFFHSPEQERAARDAVARLSAGGRYRDPVVTEVLPAPEFWRAEEYHQRYLTKRGRWGCVI